MESMSILSLNDDCLLNVVCNLNDFSSFYNFSLTCKRFNQLAENERNWHINVLKRKAEFYIRQFIVYSDDDRTASHDSSQQLYFLLEETKQCSIELLSYNVHGILDVWKSCGPVAAKFLSWIKSSSSVTKLMDSPIAMEPHRSYKTKYTKQTFHLPSSGQELSINTYHFMDLVSIFTKWETKVKVSSGDLTIEVSTIIPEEYEYSMNEQEVKAFVDPMRPVIELLQKELGHTVPPITDKFFVWMCFCCPRLEEEHRVYLGFTSLSKEHKIYFKDEAKNVIPTPESLECALALYRQNKSDEIKQSLEKWLKGNEESYSAKMTVRVLQILVQKSQAAIIKQLREDVSVNVVFDRHLQEVPKKMMLDLVNRTTLSGVVVVVDKFEIRREAHFRMKGGSVIKVDGKMGRIDALNSTELLDLFMNFMLPWPNGKKIKMDYNDRRDVKNIKGFIKKFSPITEILQECIDEAMKDEEKIPKIQNIFTVFYFLRVLHLSFAAFGFEMNCSKQPLFKYE